MVFLSGLLAAGKHLAKTAYKGLTEYDNANGGHLQKFLHRGLRNGAKKLAGWVGNTFGGEYGDVANYALNKLSKWSEGQELSLKKNKKKSTALVDPETLEAPEAPAAVAVQGNQNDMTASRMRSFRRMMRSRRRH